MTCIYRLNVIRFVIPPLRERREDIPLMFHHYLSLHARAEVPPLVERGAPAARGIFLAWKYPRVEDRHQNIECRNACPT